MVCEIYVSDQMATSFKPVHKANIHKCLLILVIIVLIIFLGLLVKILEESYNQFFHTIMFYAKWSNNPGSSNPTQMALLKI